MDFIKHKDECKCNFCQDGVTPLEYAIHHAGYFDKVYYALLAIDKTIKECEERNVEPEYLNFWQCVREETTKLEGKDVWEKRGFYKK